MVSSNTFAGVINGKWRLYFVLKRLNKKTWRNNEDREQEVCEQVEDHEEESTNMDDEQDDEEEIILNNEEEEEDGREEEMEVDNVVLSRFEGEMKVFLEIFEGYRKDIIKNASTEDEIVKRLKDARSLLK